MKALILSDLHLEHGEPFIVEKIDGVELLILAGDIGCHNEHYDFIKDCTTKYKVLYILGNHEFFGHSLQEVRDFWKNVKLDNFYFLDNSSILIENTLFIGSTLWVDFNSNSSIVKTNAQKNMNDYKYILNNDKSDKIIPDNILSEFYTSLIFLRDEIKSNNHVKKVIITHHAPSYLSVSPNYIENPIVPLYASNLDCVVKSSNADLWIHGHMHNSSDYYIGETRVVANPRGYINENKEGFNPRFVIDLSKN